MRWSWPSSRALRDSIPPPKRKGQNWDLSIIDLASSPNTSQSLTKAGWLLLWSVTDMKDEDGQQHSTIFLLCKTEAAGFREQWVQRVKIQRRLGNVFVMSHFVTNSTFQRWVKSKKCSVEVQVLMLFFWSSSDFILLCPCETNVLYKFG